MQTHDTCWGLLRRRTCLVPTWRGGVLLGLLLLGSLLLVLLGAHPFLAVSEPAAAEVLAVEGWVSDHVLAAVVRECERQSYSAVYVTGGPLERGAPLSEFKTYAELGAATLVQLGLPAELIHSVPAPPVRRDRTYAAALALHQWLREHEQLPHSLTVVSEGAHARRSRLLYRRTFPEVSQVGVLTVPALEYDPARWWCSSQGFRTVISEGIGYLYVRCWFRP